MSAPGRHERRDNRAPNAGHVAAILTAGVMFLFLVGLAIFGAARNGLTPREIAAGSVALVGLAVAASWIGREARQRRREQS